jgi:hypothetical protein
VVAVDKTRARAYYYHRHTSLACLRTARKGVAWRVRSHLHGWTDGGKGQQGYLFSYSLLFKKKSFSLLKSQRLLTLTKYILQNINIYDI